MDRVTIQHLVDEINNFNRQGKAELQGGQIVPDVFIVGTEYVGKSTLFNLLLGVDKAPISEIPSTTEVVVDGVWANALRFVDGVTYTGKYSAFGSSIQRASVFVQVCDIQAIRRLDFDLTKILAESGVPFVVVLNKIDVILTSEKRSLVQKQFEDKVGRSVLLISALRGENVNNLVYEIGRLLKENERIEFAEALARHMRVLERNRVDTHRRMASAKIIKNYIRQVVKVSKDPSDLAEIVFLHSEMIQAIADVYGVDSSLDVVESRAEHIIRSAIHVLSQSIPLIGDRVSAISAMVWTTSIGNAAVEFFERRDESSQISAVIKYYAGMLE